MTVDSRTIYEQVDQEFACAHIRAAVRVKMSSSGARHYWRQCLRCGRGIESVKRESIVNPDHVDRFDTELADTWWRKRDERWQEIHQERRAQESATWFQSYNAYLAGPEWELKRDAVLERDHHLCRARLIGCEGQARQVHHLTYAHVGNEPLFDLVSVCEWCHKEITHMDRKRR